MRCGDEPFAISTSSTGEDAPKIRQICKIDHWDSHLARQLDRVPFLPDSLVCGRLPQMQVSTNPDGPEDEATAPEIYTERLLQVRLAIFWRSCCPTSDVVYEPTHAEQRYEKFRTEYLAKLPRAFALKPETKWDKQCPRLVLQRHLLHIYIFDSICCNFRQLLSLQPAQIAALPSYKQVLLQSQKTLLASAALKELDSISSLHTSFTGGRARLGAIVFNTFEAAVLLSTLYAQQDFQLIEEGPSINVLNGRSDHINRKRVIEAIEVALGRLQSLAGVNAMAASGAKTLAQLHFNLLQENGSSISPSSNILPCDFSEGLFDRTDMSSLTTSMNLSSEPPSENDFGFEWPELELTFPVDFHEDWWSIPCQNDQASSIDMNFT